MTSARAIGLVVHLCWLVPFTLGHLLADLYLIELSMLQYIALV